MSSRALVRLLVAVAMGGVLALPPPAASRPLYFDTFTSLYGLTEGNNLYACGVCHRRWEGTGARNPFGTAVEQQLYLAKPIAAAIRAVEGDDTDLDGVSNVAEIAGGTLPGYSCDNYLLVINPPANFQSLITPGAWSRRTSGSSPWRRPS